MKLISILGILMLAAATMYGEWKSSKEKRARIVSAGITAVAAVIGIILLFQPRLPGPTQVMKVVFGSLDKIMK
ncbi:hypothetical protein NSQ38_21615 [Paenibacillus sp. FSL R7-0313]|uniref:hypothetical protein n=1 Tax=Paenibacillus sp. FSL R7-0313 TaxID=2954532 RepID=UPI0030D90963